VVLLPLEAGTRSALLALAGDLRAAGLRVVTPLASRGVSKDLKDAARQGARFAVLVLPDELARGAVVVRNLARGEQREVPRERVAEALRVE
jgi:histidyl-tRNA synthetase